MIRGVVGNGSGGGLTEVWSNGSMEPEEPVVVLTLKEFGILKEGSDLLPEVTARLERLIHEHDTNCPPKGLLDAAYRERAQVVAALVRTNNWRTWRIEAPDAFGWWIVYAETPQGQVSWHVSERDVDLFRWVPVALPDSPGWDGHSTEEKYQRLARLGPNGT